MDKRKQDKWVAEIKSVWLDETASESENFTKHKNLLWNEIYWFPYCEGKLSQIDTRLHCTPQDFPQCFTGLYSSWISWLLVPQDQHTKYLPVQRVL
jgi:hypothetical protein